MAYEIEQAYTHKLHLTLALTTALCTKNSIFCFLFVFVKLFLLQKLLFYFKARFLKTKTKKKKYFCICFFLKGHFILFYFHMLLPVLRFSFFFFSSRKITTGACVVLLFLTKLTHTHVVYFSYESFD